MELHLLNILKDERKKVTYLFGAGASANALPVLNGMNDRLDLFVYFLKIATKTFNYNESPKFRINEIVLSIKLIPFLMKLNLIKQLILMQRSYIY